MMQLVISTTSPYVRKVLVTAAELGLGDRIERVKIVARPDQTIPEVNAVNPLGKVPALVTEHGQRLFDSRVICRYLDDMARGGLYPEGNWDVPVLEALADGITDAALSMVFEVRFHPGEGHNPDWLGWQWAKISRALDYLEAEWLERLGGPLDAGQIALGCALGYLDLRHDARGWRDGRPGLAAWQAGFSQRASMAATVPSD